MIHTCLNLSVKPFEDKRNYRFEIFDDLTILMSIYHLYAFTKAFPDPKERFRIGWSLVVTMGFNASIKVTLAFIDIIRKSVRQIKESCRKCKEAKNRPKENKDSQSDKKLVKAKF